MNRLMELSDEEKLSVYEACKNYAFNSSSDDDSTYAIEFYKFMLPLYDKYGYKYRIKFKVGSMDMQEIIISGDDEPYVFDVKKELIKEQRKEKLKTLL